MVVTQFKNKLLVRLQKNIYIYNKTAKLQYMFCNRNVSLCQFDLLILDYER